MNMQRTADVVRQETVVIETDHKGVRILRTTALGDLNLDIIDDDVDTGGDPYNSTGQHCVIKESK